MIRCNLSVILAERNLKITKVAQDTGLSRTTITGLVMNYAQGIQFDTLNKLCVYLRITPDELISFVPVDLKVHSIEYLDDWSEGAKSEETNIRIWFEVSDKNYSATDYLNAEMSIKREGNTCVLSVFIPMNEAENDEDGNMLNKLINAIQKLPRPFLIDVEDRIGRMIIDNMQFAAPMISYAVDWDDGYIRS